MTTKRTVKETISHLSSVKLEISIQKRKQELIRLQQLINENKDLLLEALHKDLHKSKSEGYITELAIVLNGIDDALLTIDSYMTDEKVDLGKWKILMNLDGKVRHLPLGLVLIIGAWNYPVQLTLLPLVGALAGGNRAVLKPSEVSQNTSKLLAELVPKYLDQEIVAVVEGGIPETTELISSPKFDLIFFTGSTAVGRIVYKEAAKNLTPVVLELGGKSPTVVDRNVNLKTVARRIIYGKMMNLGQTCIAPDYIIMIGDGTAREQLLVHEMKKAMKEFYKLKDLKDLGQSQVPRIISEKHVERLSGLVENSKNRNDGTQVDQTGSVSITEKTFPLTFITGLTLSNFDSHPVMHEEIFGPILPIITVASVEQALTVIEKVGSTPLTEYVFSDDKETISKLSTVNAGNLLINDTMIDQKLNAAIENLPFGGVGDSGMGKYHGKYSMETFTRKQAVLTRGIGYEFLNEMRYPHVSGTPESAGYKVFTGLLVNSKPPSWVRIGVERYGSYTKFVLIFALGMALGLSAKL